MARGQALETALALLVAVGAAACSYGPNRYTVVNRTTQDVALVWSERPGGWIVVPACGQVESPLSHAASDAPPAGPVLVYFPSIPRGPEGGTVDTVVIASDRVLNYGTDGPPSTPCAGPAPSSSVPPGYPVR